MRFKWTVINYSTGYGQSGRQSEIGVRDASYFLWTVTKRNTLVFKMNKDVATLSFSFNRVPFLSISKNAFLPPLAVLHLPLVPRKSSRWLGGLLKRRQSILLIPLWGGEGECDRERERESQGNKDIAGVGIIRMRVRMLVVSGVEQIRAELKFYNYRVFLFFSPMTNAWENQRLHLIRLRLRWLSFFPLVPFLRFLFIFLMRSLSSINPSSYGLFRPKP